MNGRQNWETGHHSNLGVLLMLEEQMGTEGIDPGENLL